MSEEEGFPNLGPDSPDRAGALLRSAAGLVPGAGALISEIINELIPNQRQERLEIYVRMLSKKLDCLSEEVAHSRLHRIEAIAVFEDGAFQAARATSDERREHISSVVAFGISGEEKDLIEAKRLLGILQEVDDVQLVILSSYLWKNRHDEKFQTLHADILSGPRAHLGSDRKEIDESVIYDLARQKLVSLSLLRPKFSKPKRGELPEFDDKTGMIKSSGNEITPLGRLLLRRAGLADEEDV